MNLLRDWDWERDKVVKPSLFSFAEWPLVVLQTKIPIWPKSTCPTIISSIFDKLLLCPIFLTSDHLRFYIFFLWISLIWKNVRCKGWAGTCVAASRRNSTVHIQWVAWPGSKPENKNTFLIRLIRRHLCLCYPVLYESKMTVSKPARLVSNCSC